MTQILLHKQPLTQEQIDKLAASGVIAIQTSKPKDFHFLDVQVPQIELNDMLWACLDAIDPPDATYSKDSAKELARNLAKLAHEYRERRVAPSPQKPQAQEKP